MAISSQIATLTTSSSSSHFHKAWHLIGVLLTLGRPLRPPELASMSRFFAASPEFVEFLCSIPNSPLFLTSNHFVTISLSVVIALGEFLSRSDLIVSFVPGICNRGFGFGRFWFDSVGGGLIWARKRKRLATDFGVTYLSRKKVNFSCLDGQSDDGNLFYSLTNTPIACAKVDFHNKGMNTHPTDLPTMSFDLGNQFKPTVRTALLENANVDVGLIYQHLKNFECVGGKEEIDTSVQEKAREISFSSVEPFPCNHHPASVARKLYYEPTLLADTTITPVEPFPSNYHQVSVARKLYFEPTLLADTAEQNEAEVNGMIINNKVDFHAAISLSEAEKQKNMLPLEIRNHNFAVESTNASFSDSARGFKGLERPGQSGSLTPEVEFKSLFAPCAATRVHIPPAENLKRLNTLNYEGILPTFDKVTADQSEVPVTYPAAELSVLLEKVQKSPTIINTARKNALTLTQPLYNSFELTKSSQATNEQQKRKRDHLSSLMKQKAKQSFKKDMNNKGKMENTVVNPPKDKLETKTLPNFESFVVEEEEGSGGYGTVYRASRKSDRKMFAIKCPHANAHRYHVTNELKMLERFGGKNFIIKYEGSFKSGNSDCFILEHVDHDRPEVLKKEIDVFQLQWYGYCMFRALASLHKMGIVHRDVKPGNFLFSREVNKGYLIDFNLALDLHQKHGNINKSKASDDGSSDRVQVSHLKPVTSKSTLGLKNLKKNALEQRKYYKDSSSRNSVISQGADGSGITSTKDVTSTRNLSTERRRESMCWLGTRKELNNLAQEACHIPCHESVSVPVSGRKRVAAPPVKMDREAVYLSPMPLNLPGGLGAGLLNIHDNKKRKREGSCVGTKGFRAPEVLLKSQYQGPKIDVWSAGVTLLYLMTGRVPFVGEPDQNLKDIAKLRGSEDLWEIAKLHGRESSFPQDLFDIQWLPSIKLREWSEANTRKQNFIQKIPRSLFDLVDKCLIVNPRLRISAEEALSHEFFTPCHEAFKKQRQQRQMKSSHAGSTRL